MRNILVVVDMQNDFIDGALGTAEAVEIVPAVVEKIKSFDRADVYATRDTHDEHYPETQEGHKLPVPHCYKGTEGWEIRDEIAPLIPDDHIFDKPTFGSVALAEEMKKIYEEEGANGEASLTIELCGLCTGICVVYNALVLKATLPEVPVRVDAACCACVTPEAHDAAIATMRTAQVEIL